MDVNVFMNTILLWNKSWWTVSLKYLQCRQGEWENSIRASAAARKYWKSPFTFYNAIKKSNFFLHISRYSFFGDVKWIPLKIYLCSGLMKCGQKDYIVWPYKNIKCKIYSSVSNIASIYNRPIIILGWNFFL